MPIDYEDNIDGGAAFPSLSEGGDASGMIAFRDPGMSLRDYFAAAAMQGMLAVSPMEGQIGSEIHAHPDKVAAWSYQQADAMIEARNEYYFPK